MTDADAQYFKAHGIEARLNELINQLAEQKPSDPMEFIAQQLGGSGSPAAAAAARAIAASYLCPAIPGEPAPSPSPGADGMVCPCNLFGQITFDEPVVSKHDKTQHPPWYPAISGVDMGLRVHNTLTETLVPFVPASGRRVLWYTCGPTVYDACHMGHARAYLTFDILRRILEDYFRYEVLYHINITDIDDKIILRARHNKLLADFQAAHGTDYAAVLDKVTEALDTKRAKLDKKLKALEQPLPAGTPSRDVEAHETEKKATALKRNQFDAVAAAIEVVKSVAEGGAAGVSTIVAQLSATVGCEASVGALGAALAQKAARANEAIEAKRDAMASEGKPDEEVEAAIAPLNAAAAEVSTAQAKLSAVVAAQSSPPAALLQFASSELAEKLDAELGSTITDHSIFDAHARKWEKAYMEDMESLGVKDPDVMTRVTEYVPKIIAFVEKIVSRGLAYRGASGSVYLDIAAFKEQGHHYRKLVPFSGETSEADMAEGEGALAADTSEKKDPNDFALWKNSKPGEPAWSSPWGEGRPGWHIECSVVAGDILGANMDIHAGGSDLKFPHHDNELAQSEAYYGHHQWVNYFFHAGHLHIKGLKMSKSLKNFITIRQALKEHSARQLRLMFLMQPWDKPMNFSDQTVGAAKVEESRFKNFFGTVKALLRSNWLEQEVGWRDMDTDRALSIKILDTQSAVHTGMCSNFDTPSVISALADLVTYCNIYLARPEGKPAVYLLKKAAIYTTQILKVVGVAEGSDEIGFPVSGASSEAEVEGVLDQLTEFRDRVRAIARSKGSVDDIEVACDEVEKAAAEAGAGPKAVRLEEQVAAALGDFVKSIRAESKKGYPAILAACDYVRDDAMTEIGVRLEDATVEGAASTWKLDDPGTLKKEVALKREEAAKKQAQGAAKEKAKKQKELAKLEAAAKPALEVLGPDVTKAGFETADVDAWIELQPPPKPKGKPSPEFLEAMKAATEQQNAYLEKLSAKSGGKTKPKALKKKLDVLVKKKTALDKDHALFLEKGGEAYLQKLRAELGK